MSKILKPSVGKMRPTTDLLNLSRVLLIALAAGVVVAFTGCGGHHDSPRAPYVSLSIIEATYGPLITAGNHPTGNQNGTGERVGFFQDPNGSVWGLPLAIASSGELLACAPPAVHEAKVTDSIPAGSTIIGATNEPTGFRDGTGKLELLLRDSRGTIHRQQISGAQVTAGPVCWAPDVPGPRQRLDYYRLASRTDENR
jgi:hypothetical protein